MNNNSERNSASNPPAVNEFSLVISAIKIVVLAIFLVPFVKYTIVSRQEVETNSNVSLENKSIPEENQPQQNNLTENEKTSVVKLVIIPQPACPKSQLLLILDEICTDVVFKHRFCSPGDIHNPKKHKMPKYHAKNKSNKDPTGTFPFILIHTGRPDLSSAFMSKSTH